MCSIFTWEILSFDFQKEDSKDKKDSPSTSGGSSSSSDKDKKDSKDKDKDKDKDDKSKDKSKDLSSKQAVATLAVAVVAMGEQVAEEMTTRIFGQLVSSTFFYAFLNNFWSFLCYFFFIMPDQNILIYFTCRALSVHFT